MSSVGIKPLEDRIVVKPSDAEQTTASGLVIPDTAKEKPQEGEVVAVGPGRFDDGVRVPMDVKVGDRVMYSKYGGTEVKLKGTEYLVLRSRHSRDYRITGVAHQWQKFSNLMKKRAVAWNVASTFLPTSSK